MKSKKFRYEFQLPFRYADSAGISFFGNIFDLTHDVLEKFIIAQGFTWSEWFDNPQIAAPIRYAESDYRQPMRPGNVYTCETEILDTSTSSVTLQFSFLINDALCASVKLVLVFVDKQNGTKCAIPDAFRERLAVH